MGIKTISSREVYRNPWTSVREDVIERANGQRGIYGVIDKDPACIIVPLDDARVMCGWWSSFAIP